MTAKRLLVLLVAIALTAGMSVAQGPKKDVGAKVPLPDLPAGRTGDRPQGPPASLSIDVDLVNFDVVVTDNNGNPIAGLEKSHFKVFDDNVEQAVTNFSPTEAPL